MSKTSVAINNLRGFVVVMVVAFHASMAYLSSQPPIQPPFDTAKWTATPIVDSTRWLPLDLFSAFQFLCLMQLLFFLSGVFTWPSLKRKGTAQFLRDRALRLGLPFLMGAFLLMPAAYYAVYRVTALDPSLSAFWRHWTALPFWPNGPMWFLWFLLVLDVAAAALYRLSPRAVEVLAGLTASTRAAPGQFFVALLGISALACLPCSLLFTPWQWAEFGPFSFQPAFAPQYIIYFFAGLLVGANGLENSFLEVGGKLADRAGFWIAGAFASFGAWLATMALVVTGQAPHLVGVKLVADANGVLFAAFAVFAATTLFTRFAHTPSPVWQSLCENGYGIYVFHYVFVLWTQYVLLGSALFALIKAVIVFSASLLLSWAASAAVFRIPIGARLLRGERRALLTKAVTPAGRGSGWHWMWQVRR